MSANQHVLDAIIASLADGASIDWTSLDHRRLADHDRRLLSELRLVARIAAVHRDDSGDPPPAPAGRGAGLEADAVPATHETVPVWGVRTRSAG